MNLLSVHNTAFTVLGYPMSYIEFVGTILYLWSVWLIAKRRVLTWPVGIVSVLLYMALFYQIRLYSDTLEQIYYLVACTYGWWRWAGSQTGKGEITDVRFSAARGVFIAIAVTIVLSIADGYLMSRVHLFAPKLFPEQASYPYLDALTTIMSFTAMWLMALKRIESWIYWIIVDVIGIGLYYAKDVKFVSLLYVILLFLAIKGLWSWINTYRMPGGGGTE